jgi:hypothetical protein
VADDDPKHRQTSDAVEEDDFFGRRWVHAHDGFRVRVDRKRAKNWNFLRFLDVAMDFINGAEQHEQQNHQKDDSENKENV